MVGFWKEFRTTENSSLVSTHRMFFFLVILTVTHVSMDKNLAPVVDRFVWYKISLLFIDMWSVMFEPHSSYTRLLFCWSSCPSSCNELSDGKPSSFYAFCRAGQTFLPLRNKGFRSWPLVRETNHTGLLRRPSFWGGVRFGWGVCWLAIIVFLCSNYLVRNRGT